MVTIQMPSERRLIRLRLTAWTDVSESPKNKNEEFVLPLFLPCWNSPKGVFCMSKPRTALLCPHIYTLVAVVHQLTLYLCYNHRGSTS